MCVRHRERESILARDRARVYFRKFSRKSKKKTKKQNKQKTKKKEFLSTARQLETPASGQEFVLQSQRFHCVMHP
jgi:hypothetical protein